MEVVVESGRQFKAESAPLLHTAPPFPVQGGGGDPGVNTAVGVQGGGGIVGFFLSLQPNVVANKGKPPMINNKAICLYFFILSYKLR